MNSATVLQEWSQARAALSASLTPQAVGIIVGRHRALSGIRWRGNLIVTAAEALGGSEEAIVVAAEGEDQAAVIACDPATDVAVLRVSADATAIGTTASSLILEIGAGVVFAGRSRRGPLISFGTVRLTGPAWSSRRGGAIDQRLEFEGNLDARFEGALVADFAGGIQAMLVTGPGRTLLGIPASTVERVVAIVERHGYLPRPYLGVRLQSLWLDDTTRLRWGRAGRQVAAVAGIEPGSPAERAGVVPGDLLESIDGAAVDDVEAVAIRVARSAPGQSLGLRVRRGGEPLDLKVEVAEWRARRV